MTDWNDTNTNDSINPSDYDTRNQLNSNDAGELHSELGKHEVLFDMYIFDTTNLLNQLERTMLDMEGNKRFTEEDIDEIFRIIHTIKGTSAMMRLNRISVLVHEMEEIFFCLRECKEQENSAQEIVDLVLKGIDIINEILQRVMNDQPVDVDITEFMDRAGTCINMILKDKDLNVLKQRIFDNEKFSKFTSNVKENVYAFTYQVHIRFVEGCEMENLRAFSAIAIIKEFTDQIFYEQNIDYDESIPDLQENGFWVWFLANESEEVVREKLAEIPFMEEFELELSMKDMSELKLMIQVEFEEEEEIFEVVEEEIPYQDEEGYELEPDPKYEADRSSIIKLRQDEIVRNENRVKVIKNNVIHETELHLQNRQSVISVNVDKLDKLMELVGEMVIAESMVVQSPDLAGKKMYHFRRAISHLNKITNEIQDMVMSVRLIPLSATFVKMHRIVRDMSKILGKNISLEVMGEETEVDKNIIEHISDPLMHLVRNAIDHGIEMPQERQEKGKANVATIRILAENIGSDILIFISDDGKGFNKKAILKRARAQNLLYKDEDEMSENEIINLVFTPGFSTNYQVTEFSGRGVGMDVVINNIEAIGGMVFVKSMEDVGTSIVLKIPLTLASIDGMLFRLDDIIFTVPTIAVKKFFVVKKEQIFVNDKKENIIVFEDESYVLRWLDEIISLDQTKRNYEDGIVLMLEMDEKRICVLVDELMGQQQVVVKSLPDYIKRFGNILGISGCTLLGNGDISLIIDVVELCNA